MTSAGMGPLKIGIIGPTKIGKSTIVNCLLRSGESLLARSSVAMRWGDEETELRIQKLRNEMEGWLVSRRFRPGAMSGTEAPFQYQLKFDPGVPEAELPLAILDYPGGWLDPAKRAGHEVEWEACREFIAESTVLIIPIDAVILMSTVNDPHRHHVPTAVTISAVEPVVREWAQHRHQLTQEPALAIIVPVRTESYFTDNGGHRDRSVELYDQVREVYASVLRAIKEEAPAARVRFCPVDTMGCVELMSVQWQEQGNETPQFSANYRIRRRPDNKAPEITMAGIDDVTVLIARHLFELGTNALRDEARERHVTADELTDYAETNEGAWLNLWYSVSGERKRRRSAAEQSRSQAAAADELVADLGRQLKRLADLDLSDRVRDL